MSKNYTSRTLGHHEITDPETDWIIYGSEAPPLQINDVMSVGAALSSGHARESIERRTPIEAPKEPVCEAGYRWMREGEITQCGDEWIDIAKDWNAVTLLNNAVSKQLELIKFHRRPINQDGSDLWQMVNGVLARRLMIGEEIKQGDFFEGLSSRFLQYDRKPGSAINAFEDNLPSYRPAPTQPAKPLESPESTKAAPEPEKQATEAPEKPDGALDYFKDRMRLLDLDIQELIDDRNKWKALAERQAKTIDNIRAAMDGETD